MVLTKRIQTTLRSDTNPCARAEETGLQMGGRTTSRLCPLCRQYRTAARRGLATSVPRCHDRFRRQFKKDNPGLNFSVSLPDIEELATIKSIALSIEEGNAIYYLSVYIHTHNGNRVFENVPVTIINNQAVPCCDCHPYQDKFVESLRDIIKKNKHKMKPGNKSGSLYNNMRQYASTA